MYIFVFSKTTHDIGVFNLQYVIISAYWEDPSSKRETKALYIKKKRLLQMLSDTFAKIELEHNM